MDTNNEKQKIILSKVGITILVVLTLLVVGSVGTAYYFYNKANTKVDPQTQAVKDLAETVQMVGKLMVLPKDEEPTMATVSDPEKLKDQPFFVNAKKGDKVLIYSNARKAILYSPSLKKIIEVAPVNLGATASQISN